MMLIDLEEEKVKRSLHLMTYETKRDSVVKKLREFIETTNAVFNCLVISEDLAMKLKREIYEKDVTPNAVLSDPQGIAHVEVFGFPIITIVGQNNEMIFAGKVGFPHAPNPSSWR